ncbi:MAG: RNA 2',3'-cyclic phosphodiesterase [Chloroflexi bacterium]|nr:RNA 2',3'-cyclic phosphodiesterase [Chloroflexota bacterium]
MATEQIRSFIAIELPNEIKEKLSQFEARLKSTEMPWVKWVDPNSIHLTLKFLGNIDADKVGEITEAIEESARGIPPFSLEAREAGVFPDLRRPRVAWVGLGGETDKLLELQQHLESNLEILGFTPEGRDFTPHLTVARLDRATPDERQKFGQLIARSSFEAVNINVEAISLMRSQLTRAGAIYSRLSSVALKSQ